MRTLLGGVLAVLCMKLLSEPMAYVKSTDRACSIDNCVAYGGPNERYSLRIANKSLESNSGGWIVGEIRTLAFGADNSVLVQNLARNGWVECAGQLINSKDFPEAAEVLQGTWGSTSTGKTQIYLPDLRGLVLRGWHHARRAPANHLVSPYTGDADLTSRVFPRPELLDSSDPGIAGPTDSNTKQLIKDHVGSMQAEQFHGHRHSFSAVAGNGTIQVQKGRHSDVTSGGEPLRIGSSTAFEGGNETHPPNAYVLYVVYLGRPAEELPASPEDQKAGRRGRVVILEN
jgi:hypothetical protein